MRINLSSGFTGAACSALLLLGFAPLAADAAALTACLGTAEPDIADGRYDCNVNDVKGSVEQGEHLYINWHDTRGDEVRQITLDLKPSDNADLSSRFAYFADNLDGARIVSESVQNNTYIAYTRDFTDAVDNFYLGMDFKQRSTGNGTPLSPDYNGATLTVRTLHGREFSCPFRHVDRFTASTDRLSVLGGLRVRPAWFLPCQQMPSIKHEFELLNRLQSATIATEMEFCEENPDSPICE